MANDFEFETEVEVDDMDNHRHGKAMLKWGVEFECRSWGIKSVIPFVRDQEFKGWLSKNDTYEDITHDDDEQEVTFNLKDVRIEDGEFDDGGCLCPSLLSIDDGKFIVTF